MTARRTAEIVLFACCVMMALLVMRVGVRAQEAHCDWKAAFDLLAADKRFGKPITASGPTAAALSAIAHLNGSQQAMLVPVYGATPEQLRFVILVCGPKDTWQPRHFMIDAEAERRFYNLAPPQPAENDEQPKPNRTRKAQK